MRNDLITVVSTISITVVLGLILIPAKLVQSIPDSTVNIILVILFIMAFGCMIGVKYLDYTIKHEKPNDTTSKLPIHGVEQ